MMISARAIYHSIPLITFYLLTPSLFSPLFISIHKQLKFFSSWKGRPSPPQEKILQKMLSRRKFNPSTRRSVDMLKMRLLGGDARESGTRFRPVWQSRFFHSSQRFAFLWLRCVVALLRRRPVGNP